MEGNLFSGQYLIWVILLLGQLHGCKSCIVKERKALLELKNDMISRSVVSLFGSILPTWNNDTKSDCCRWKGMKCNHTSGQVIGLSFDDMYFNGNTLLNLSLLHPFEELRSLNLSSLRYNGFFDDIEDNKSLRRLRNLEILDLSNNRFNNSIFPFLNAATSLRSLYIRDNSMDGSFPFKELKDLTNLELLDLRGNRFNGSMLAELTHLKKLKSLDLSSNPFLRSLELQGLKNLTNLEVLGLAENNLDGPIPIEVICEMNNLRELDLHESYLVDQLPPCLGRLQKLRVLDLSSNQLSGNLPSSFSSLESLEYLSLLDNNFTGLFSLSQLTNLTKLKVLKLSSTPDMVQVDIESNWQPKFQLSVAVLRSCSLDKIPSFLVYQNNLRLVDLSSNRFSGDIPTWLLVNNPELEVLQLQNNSFTIFQMPTIVHDLLVLDFSSNNIGGLFPDNIGRALPNLVHMNGSNNGFQGHFPSSIGEMKNISFLDLSYNNFSGKLPRSFVTGCFSLQYLKLSHNKFSGHFLPRGTNFTSLNVLRMDNNLFSGKIGVGLFNLSFLELLDISNNSLTGAIPSWIFNLSYLKFLLLSNNFFEGTISSSSLNLPSLSFLDLSGNLFSGALPSHVNSSVLGKNLFLHDNNFTGPIPDTLLEHIQTLDLRNNKLSGSIPQFVHTQSIYFLLLRGNNLTGSIPRQLCDMRNIGLLDLSDNELNGFIPSYLYNLSFGLEGEGFKVDYSVSAFITFFQSEFYKSTFVIEKFEAFYSIFHEIEIKFATKQRYDSYIGRYGFLDGILGDMYGMDLSNNELSGVIPVELGNLSKLRALNLSHNFLSSSIPSSFSNLKDIESLDLSNNKLQGSIPHQLTNLTSLAVFDVSYNNLSGIIPQGKQFNTFDANKYLGNPLLCGPPTNRSCEDKKRSEEAGNGGGEEDDEAAIDMLAFYCSTASTYVIALIGILVLMCIDCPWRRAWVRIVDAFIALVKSMLP